MKKLFSSIWISVIFTLTYSLIGCGAASLLLVTIGISPVTPIAALAVSLAVTGVSLIRIFGTLGADEAHAHAARLSALRYILIAIFPIAVLTATQFYISRLFGISFAGGVQALVLLLHPTEENTIPAQYALLSAAIHFVVYLAISYFAYRYGFLRREKERTALLSGNTEALTAEAEKFRTPLAKKLLWIPIANLIPVISLIGAYLWSPEKKLRRILPLLLILFVLFLLLQAGVLGLYQLFPNPWLILTARLASLYLFGIISSLLALRDR